MDPHTYKHTPRETRTHTAQCKIEYSKKTKEKEDISTIPLYADALVTNYLAPDFSFRSFNALHQTQGFPLRSLLHLHSKLGHPKLQGIFVQTLEILRPGGIEVQSNIGNIFV